jgi:RNA polymerase sigma factor (TIGR02999 family)
MPDEPARTVTRLLQAWQRGERDALDRLMPLVYDELRRIAARLMRSERREHTLDPTAVVHEAYARLAAGEAAAADRLHFLSLAARVMRRVLVDHDRSRGRAKRGPGFRVTLTDAAAASPDLPADRLVEIDAALERLEALDVRKLRVLELRIFGGLTHTEIADVLSVSVPTVERDFRMARAWLRAELEGSAPGHAG